MAEIFCYKSETSIGLNLLVRDWGIFEPPNSNYFRVPLSGKETFDDLVKYAKKLTHKVNTKNKESIFGFEGVIKVPESYVADIYLYLMRQQNN